MTSAGDGMARGNTTRRTVRVDDDLWTTALAVAAEHGENLSDIIRQALRDYIQQRGTK